jgi:putative flippase GtrA
MGFGVQAAVLWTLIEAFGIPTSFAVGLAVFAAVSHNFAWHERFTWPGCAPGGRVKRWIAFNATTGALSIVANVALTGMIARQTGLPIVAANLIAVGVLSVATFIVSGEFIFSGSSGAGSCKAVPCTPDPAAPNCDRRLQGRPAISATSRRTGYRNGAW